MKVLVYPTFSNPYQNLLYEHLAAINQCEIRYFDSGIYKKHYSLFVLSCIPRLIYYRFIGYSIFHLHWQDFRIPFFIREVEYLLSTVYALMVLVCLKLLGYKLIWTVHNIVPHQRKYLNDLWMATFIMRLSDSIIVHSRFTQKELIEMGIPAKKLTVIPQGNYIGVYPNTITQQEARSYFDIPLNHFTILFFGLIREYKGLDDLLEICKQIPPSTKITLLIGGRCPDEIYRKKLVKEIGSLAMKVIYRFEHIPDNMVQYYFNAANIAIFPFKQVTTSSSVLLALSFGKPVIVPYKGMIHDLPQEIGFFYNNISEAKVIVERLMKNRNDLQQKTKKAKSISQSYSWRDNAIKTMKIYRTVIGK